MITTSEVCWIARTGWQQKMKNWQEYQILQWVCFTHSSNRPAALWKHIQCILIQKIFFQFFLLKIISIALSRENLFYSGQKFYEMMWITFLCRFYCVVSRLYHYRKTQFQLDLSWISVIMKASNHELSPAHKNIPLTYKEMKSTKGDVSFWGLRSILACYLPWPHGL